MPWRLDVFGVAFHFSGGRMTGVAIVAIVTGAAGGHLPSAVASGMNGAVTNTPTNWLVIAGTLLLLAIIGSTTFLVASEDVEGELYMAVVVGPIVGGVIGAVAGIKGVQAGSQASVSPPPDA